MALSVKGWTKWTGNGTTSQAITGVGFQPKAMLFMTVETLTDDAFASHTAFAFGMATRRSGTTQQKSLAYGSDDNVATNHNYAIWDNAIITRYDQQIGGGCPVIIKVTLDSFDADGFTVTYASASSAEYFYYAIGGSDLIDACVVEDDWPTSGATFDVIGAGFQPDCAIYLSGLSAALTAGNMNNGDSRMCLGCFAGAAQWAAAISATSFDTMTSSMNYTSVFSADSCLTLVGLNVDTVDAKGIFSAFTADGATITNTNAPTAALRVFALYLKGGQYKAGSKAKASTAVADSFTFSTPTFTPTGVLLGQAVGTVSNTVIVATAELTVGGASAADGSAEGYAGFTSIEAINTQADMIKSATKAIAELTPGTTPAIDAAADMTAFASGSFTLTWDATGTAALVGFLAMGDAVVATKAPPPQLLRYQRQARRVNRRFVA